MKKIAIVVGAFTLAGCQTMSGAWDSVASGGGSTGAPPARVDTARAEPEVAMSAPAVQPGSGALSGQSGDSLRALWGEPSLRRKEIGSELWQYSGGNCTVLVYLYPSAAGLTVNHAEAVPGGAGDSAVAACAAAAGRAPLKPIS